LIKFTATLYYAWAPAVNGPEDKTMARENSDDDRDHEERQADRKLSPALVGYTMAESLKGQWASFVARESDPEAADFLTDRKQPERRDVFGNGDRDGATVMVRRSRRSSGDGPVFDFHYLHAVEFSHIVRYKSAVGGKGVAGEHGVDQAYDFAPTAKIAVKARRLFSRIPRPWQHAVRSPREFYYGRRQLLWSPLLVRPFAQFEIGHRGQENLVPWSDLHEAL
jgi:hypothetical protein